MGGQYQTIIYVKQGGRILKVLPNQYISSKQHLAKLAGQKEWSLIAFMYFPYDMELKTADLKVRRLSSNMPPSLITKSGLPIDYSVRMLERRKKLSEGANCLVEFEGGMGDQLLEAAAVLTAKAKYPKSTFGIRCEGQYVDILRHIPGIGEVQSAYVGAKKAAYNLTVSNHTSYLTDPRGGLYGKASLYGAWLGLEEVRKIARIKLNKSDFEEEKQFLDMSLGEMIAGGVMLQFRSGSGHAKSWQGEKVLKLAKRLKDVYGLKVFVVGQAREIQRGLPDIVDLTGRSTWWQTCLLESKMKAVISIDSGVMHVARSLKVPHITLWGGTNAPVILGEKEAPLDIRLQLDCYDMVCYDCPRKTNACMEGISPEMVMKNVDLLFHNTDIK